MYSLLRNIFYFYNKNFLNPDWRFIHILLENALCHVTVQIHYRLGSSCSKIKKSYPIYKSLFKVTCTIIVAISLEDHVFIVKYQPRPQGFSLKCVGPPKSSKSQAICPGSKQITNRITIMASVLITWMFSFLLLSAGKEL